MKSILVYGLSNNWGGVEAIVTSVILKLHKSCCFDIIVSKAECSYENKFKLPNIRFLHTVSWGESPKQFKESLKEILSNKVYDYVWINGCIMSNRTIISVTKKYSKAKIITHSHGSGFEEKNKLKRSILLALHYMNRRYYLRNVDFPCMCSEKSGRWFYGEKYLYNHYVHLFKNGVNLSKFEYNHDIRNEYRKQFCLSDELVLFHAGRLTAVKNQKFILDILNQLLIKKIKCKLFLAGDGELMEELNNYAIKKNISSDVIFLGARDDIPQLYQMADAFLLPSFHEGFPVTLVEAQAAGLPCFVSTSVSDETNITGNIQYLSLENNIDAWSKAVSDYKYDINSRHEMSSLLYKERYDINQVAEDFRSFIEID